MQSREKTEGGMIGLFSAIGGVYISDGSTSCVEKVEMKKKRRPTPYDDNWSSGKEYRGNDRRFVSSFLMRITMIFLHFSTLHFFMMLRMPSSLISIADLFPEDTP